MAVLGATAIKIAKKNSVYTLKKPVYHANTTFQCTSLALLPAN